MQPGIQKSRAKPRNIIKGVLPTETVATTGATNLGYAVDEDNSTTTGTATKDNVSGDYAIYTWDLGTSKMLLIRLVCNMWASAGTTSCVIETSDTSNFSSVETSLGTISTSATSRTKKMSYPIFLYGRYMRVRFSTGSSATGSAELIDVRAYEIG